MYEEAYHGIIYNHEELETASMFNNGVMAKEVMEHPSHTILGTMWRGKNHILRNISKQAKIISKNNVS